MSVSSSLSLFYQRRMFPSRLSFVSSLSRQLVQVSRNDDVSIRLAQSYITFPGKFRAKKYRYGKSLLDMNRPSRRQDDRSIRRSRRSVMNSVAPNFSFSYPPLVHDTALCVFTHHFASFPSRFQGTEEHHQHNQQASSTE